MHQDEPHLLWNVRRKCDPLCEKKATHVYQLGYTKYQRSGSYYSLGERTVKEPDSIMFAYYAMVFCVEQRK